MGYQFDFVFDPELVTGPETAVEKLRRGGALPSTEASATPAGPAGTVSLLIPNIPYTVQVFASLDSPPGHRADERGHWARVTIPWAHGTAYSLFEALLRFSESAGCGLYDRQNRLMVTDEILFDVLQSFVEGADRDTARRVDLATEQAVPAHLVVEQDLALPGPEDDLPRMHSVMPPSLATMPLSELGRLGGGIETRLLLAGLHTVGDLVQLSSDTLQQRCTLQPAQLAEINRRLRAMGLRLGLPAADAPHQNS